MRRRLARSVGFALVETLVVVATIAVLAGMTFPVLQGLGAAAGRQRERVKGASGDAGRALLA